MLHIFLTQKGLLFMSKILYKIFPLLDHLYIYQILEYNSWDFLKWFIKNPLKRNLQKKHKLQWSQKAKLLALVSLTLILLDDVITSYKLNGGFELFIILLPIKFLYGPLFLITAQILISPLEYYQKQKKLEATKEKLSKSPNLKIVAITGSFGKTSTKDILYTLLFKKYYTIKTPKSFNTPQGIAQTVLEMVKENTDIFICEMGAYRKGEIKNICSLIKPDIGIITAIAPQHLEKFGSLENIAKAKFELAQSLPKDGVAILNSTYEQIKNNAVSVNAKVIFYGSEKDPFYATSIKTKVTGTEFTMHTPQGKMEINIPLVGEHHVSNFLAATAASLQLGLTLSDIQERARLLLPTPHRLEIRKQGSLTVIDNSYNTNPKASRASLALLKDTLGSQKIIITPGLVELGNQSAKENESFAKDASRVVDEFIIVGENAKEDLLRGLRDSRISKSSIHLVTSTQEGIALLSEIAKPNAVVLLENDLPDQYS